MLSDHYYISRIRGVHNSSYHARYLNLWQGYFTPLKFLTLQVPALQNGKIHSCWLLPTNCPSVFDHFVGLVLKVLNSEIKGSQ